MKSDRSDVGVLAAERITPANEPARCVALRLILLGYLQGVGLRPAIARLASRLQLAGDVRNTRAGVEIVLEGPADAIESFVPVLQSQLPTEARISEIVAQYIEPTGRSGFHVVEGETGELGGSLRTAAPLDRAVCWQCLAEVADPSDRRYGYPLTSCVDCGPRYSIVESLPFERAATTMAQFPLCGDCRAELTRSDDRRFHSQTIACPACGPQCRYTAAENEPMHSGQAAVEAAVEALRSGRIVALKGVGGYQLLVDATNAEAVARLRCRKGRPAKPLAVLVDSLNSAERIGMLDPAAREALTSSVGPIVVVPRRTGAVAEGVHPGLDCIGVMLPTTPLHWLLAKDCPPLVATSGNREGEPLAWEDADAELRLSAIADGRLFHDRPIRRAVDDSVVRIAASRPMTIRAARGIAPLPLSLPWSRPSDGGPHLLAVGGHQKSAIALTNGVQSVLGHHLGDLDELSTRDRFAGHLVEMCQLYGVVPELVVHDAHPDYFTTRWAVDSGLPTVAVQHHHAHVVAGMIEHGWLDREVLGVAWDGTGYSSDGTVWGGEFLLATSTDFHRVARLRPFALVGGEAAIREPWRVALIVLRDAIGEVAAMQFLSERGIADQKKMSQVLQLADRPAFTMMTSSAGRLFDAVATCLLPVSDIGPGLSLPGLSAYEGHLAMMLEALCGGTPERTQAPDSLPPHYAVPIVSDSLAELDWRPLVAALIADLRDGVSRHWLAQRFHSAMADAIVTVASLFGRLPVVLCGGVFQNRQLTELVAGRFMGSPQPLGLPGMIPINDGGLAAGQLAVALACHGH